MKKSEADPTTSTDTTTAAATPATGPGKGELDTIAAYKNLSKSIISKYFVKKHSWMSKNYRRLYLTNIGEIFLVNPTTPEVTDRWRYENIVSVSPDPKNPEDFSIVVRKESKSDKVEKVTFSASLRSHLLTELLQFISQLSPHKKREMTVEEVYLSKIRHNGQPKKIILSVMPWGVCQIEHGVVVRTYLFHLLHRILTVADRPGAFVLEYGKVGKQRYLFEYNESKLSGFLGTLRGAAEKYICVNILDGRITMKQAEEDAVCCKEVLNHFNTLEEFRMFKINRTRHPDPSLRVVSLTKHWIVERMSAPDRVVSLHKIAYVERIVINPKTPGSFTIHYKNNTSGLYVCDNDSTRDSFLSYLLDCASAIGSKHVSVTTMNPDRRFCAMPPGVPVDAGTEEQLLAAIATCEPSGRRAEDFAVLLAKFNANIPYSGPKYIDEMPKLEKLAVKALEVLLRASNPSNVSAQTFAAIYRLLVVPSIFNTFIDTKSLQVRLIALIKPILSTQNYDSVLIYNMLNVVHLLAAPQMHMDFGEAENFAVNTGYDDISIIEKTIADGLRKENDLLVGSSGQIGLISSGGGSAGGNSPSNHGSRVYDDGGYDSLGEDMMADNDLVTLDNVLSDSSSRNELIEHVSEVKYFRDGGKVMLMEDDILMQLFLTHLMSCVFRESATLMVLGWINIFSALIFPDESPNRQQQSDSKDQRDNSLLDKLGMLGRGFFKLFSQAYCPSIAKNSLRMLTLLLKRRDSKVAASIRKKALSDGATLMYFRSFLYPDVSSIKAIIMSVVRRQLFRLLVTDCDPALEMVRRIVPPGLSYFLTKKDEQPNTNNNNNGDGDDTRAKGGDEKGLYLSRSRHRNDTERKLSFGVDFLNRWNRNTRDGLSGTKKLLPGELNWACFYEEFQRDHVKPDLVWNSGTRQELKTALREELSVFQHEQNVLRNKCITWNYEEFTVKYRSLEREVRVGGYYLQLLLDDQKISSVRDPMELYDLLYRRILVERDSDLQALCIQAITTVYVCFKDIIGPFRDVEYMINLMYYCNNYLVRDRLIQLFQVITSTSTANAYAFTKSKGIPLLANLLTLIHLGSSSNGGKRDRNDGSQDADKAAAPKEWYYNNRGNIYPHASYSADDKAGGPLRIEDMKRLHRAGVVTLHTLVWAQGMEEWDVLENVLPLRWALMGTGQRILSEVELCESIIDIFTKLCEAFPTKDDSGILIRPVSKPKQQLTSAKVLPHLVQLLLVRNGLITSRVAVLISILLYENPQAISQLYRTGFFYFAILQNSKDLDGLPDLFKLVKLIHRRQSVSSTNAIINNNNSETTATSSATSIASSLSSPPSSSSSSSSPSIYDGILPEGLVCYMDILPPNVYIDVITGVDQSISPAKVVWDGDMRKALIRAVSRHLGNFSRRLAENPKAVYQYEPMEPVPYSRSPSSDAQGYRVDDLFCYRYYINRIESPEDFVLNSNENPLEFMTDLNATLDIIKGYQNEVELRSIIVRLQVRICEKYPKVMTTQKFVRYDVITDTLNTAEIGDPAVSAVMMLAHVIVQSSDANISAMAACGCLAAIVRVFVALGAREIRSYNEYEKDTLKYAMYVMSFAAADQGSMAWVEQSSSGVVWTMFKVLHMYNFDDTADIPKELIEEMLSCVLKFVPNKTFIRDIVNKSLIYELVPILFRYTNQPRDPANKSADSVNIRLSYKVLKLISQYMIERRDDHSSPQVAELAGVSSTFKIQILSLLTNDALEKLKTGTPRDFFYELLCMDREYTLDKIRTYGSQYV